LDPSEAAAEMEKFPKPLSAGQTMKALTLCSITCVFLTAANAAAVGAAAVVAAGVCAGNLQNS